MNKYFTFVIGLALGLTLGYGWRMLQIDDKAEKNLRYIEQAFERPSTKIHFFNDRFYISRAWKGGFEVKQSKRRKNEN